jgi:dipeptidyl aminopeptidase/acylaminoacyl peptidase
MPHKGTGDDSMRFRLLGVMALALFWTMSVAAQVDVDSFLKRDTYGRVKISPSGAYYAATVQLPDREVLLILRRSDKKITAKVTGGPHSAIADFWWVNEERVVMAMAQKFGAMDEPQATGELHGINADGSNIKRLVGSVDQSIEGDFINFGTDIFQFAELIDTLPRDRDNILVAISSYSADPTTRVVRTDVNNGRSVEVAHAPLRRASFAADADGVIRFAAGKSKDDFDRLLYRDDDKADWQVINDERTSQHLERPLGFSSDNKTAYLRVEQTTGPDAIVAFDTATGTRKQVLRDALVDPKVVFRAGGDFVPVGAAFMTDRRRVAFFDELSPDAEVQRRMEAAFPGQSVIITSATADGSLLLFCVFSDRKPGDYYLLDRAAMSASGVFSRREWLLPEKMAATRSVELAARDSVPLHAYLTLPVGAEHNLPMVVIPHGGPFGVFDTGDFDEESQILADAGYAVLRVNFRGSGNYGRSFEHAGARQWGGKMQDDVTDATRWAIEQKIADPQRICIYGGSYGGYSAMMGLAREPDLYRCGVGYAGVYDLPLRYRALARRANYLKSWYTDWIGSPETLEAISPDHLAAAIKRPVLLAAGGEDFIAPIEHSRKMEKALTAAGNAPETLYIQTEGHGFFTEEHQRAFYVKLLDFLSRNIGGAKAK